MNEQRTAHAGFSPRTWAVYFGRSVLWCLVLLLQVFVRIALFFLADDIPVPANDADPPNPNGVVKLSLWSRGIDRRDWELSARLSALCGRSVAGRLVGDESSCVWVPSSEARADGVRQVDFSAGVQRVEYTCWPIGRATIVAFGSSGTWWFSTRRSNLSAALAALPR